MQLYDVIVWLNTGSTEDDTCLVVVEEIPPFYVKRFEYPEKRYTNVTNYYYYILHHCLFSPAHRFPPVVFMKDPNAGLRRAQRINCVSWTLFLMRFETASVRTWSFVHLILPWICLQTRHNSTWDFHAWIQCLDPTVMSHHTSASNYFLQIVIKLILLSVIKAHLICTCVFNQKHSRVHLWRM